MPWPLAVVAPRSRDWESREFDFILSIQRLNFRTIYSLVPRIDLPTVMTKG